MKKLLFLFSILIFSSLFAQQKPDFWNDIQEFKEHDSLNPPPKNAILLLGSSSFTMWRDVNSCLLYTSDAADEGLGVDLGGRRIIKKKKKHVHKKCPMSE